MNQEVRKFLIDQCVKGEPIYYEAIGQLLGLDLGLESHRQILSKTLGEISAFEYEQGRPLISSIAIYKTKNDHGYGFYNLCEELEIGKASKLSKQLYGFTQIDECKRFWRKPENYSAFAILELHHEKHELAFFKAEEIEFLAHWSGKVYNKDQQEHVAAKNYIMNSLGTKTKYWSNHLTKRIPGIDTFNWRMWSTKGWKDSDDGKIRVARFKHYTWARIYRKGDDNKDIFFTVGADSETNELVYKLDFYFEKNSHLNNAQKEIVKKNIPKEIRWKSIPSSDIHSYDWNSLLDLTASFISEHLHVYDKLIELAWGNSQPEEVFSNYLRPQDPPENGLDTVPEYNPSFTGVEIDFIKKSIDKKEIGDAGEALVRQYEIQRLKNIGYVDLANQVEIVEDGKGYDVLSFDEKRNPKYIEVKTTSGKNLTPFDFTINEREFAEQNQESYYIYRLYNYDYETNSADFFIVDELHDQVLMRPTTFKVFIKKLNQS